MKENEFWLGQRLRLTANGIFGVKVDDECAYDCSPQGPGHRFWAGEFVTVRGVLREKISFTRSFMDYLDVVTDDGRGGFVDPDEVDPV